MFWVKGSMVFGFGGIRVFSLIVFVFFWRGVGRSIKRFVFFSL